MTATSSNNTSSADTYTLAYATVLFVQMKFDICTGYTWANRTGNG